MSSEVATVVAEVVKNSSAINTLKNVASAHPIAAAGVGIVGVGLAAFGTYHLLRKTFGDKPSATATVKVDIGPAPAAHAAAQ